MASLVQTRESAFELPSCTELRKLTKKWNHRLLAAVILHGRGLRVSTLGDIIHGITSTLLPEPSLGAVLEKSLEHANTHPFCTQA
jgi:hypothetical protein